MPTSAPPSRPPDDPVWIDRGGQLRFFGLAGDGRTSSTWRLWTSRNSKDVYLAPRQLAGQVKISLHESGSYQHGFINAEVSALWQGQGADRHLDRWARPPEFEPGWTRIFEVVLPEAEMRQGHEDLGGHHYEVLPTGPGYAIHVYLFLVQVARVDRPDLRFPNANFMAVMDLGDDERVAVVAIPQEWDSEAIAIVDQARQRALAGDPNLLRPPNRDALPLPSTRFIQYATHYADDSRYVIDAAATL